MFAMLMVPLDDSTQWRELEYGNIKPNVIEYAQGHLKIQVAASSSPLVYPFNKAKKVKRIQVKGRIEGGTPPRIPASLKQGSKGYDDFPLRLGMVVQGDRRLNWLERQLAPLWLVELYRLAPEDVGLDHLLLLSVASANQKPGLQREHPLHNVIRERVVSKLDDQGRFVIDETFKTPLPTLALWVGADGDDTDANYRVIIEDITLHHPD